MTETHLSCSSSNIDDALATAERICQSNGARLTPLRQRVLELLLKANGPAKAYDLLQQISDGDTSPAKPPTVYRALDFLLEQGLAHKIESLNAYVACGHSEHHHSAAFLICEKCELALEMSSNSTLQALKQETSKMSFQFSSAVIEVRGLCKNCQS